MTNKSVSTFLVSCHDEDLLVTQNSSQDIELIQQTFISCKLILITCIDMVLIHFTHAIFIRILKN